MSDSTVGREQARELLARAERAEAELASEREWANSSEHPNWQAGWDAGYARAEFWERRYTTQHSTLHSCEDKLAQLRANYDRQMRQKKVTHDHLVEARAERDAAREAARALWAEARSQWESNHWEHCGERLPPHEGICKWPLPDPLARFPDYGEPKP